MTEERKAPSIRFKKFSGQNAEAWEQRKLGDVGETKSGVGFPDSEQGGMVGVPFYKVSDMNNIGNEIEMVTSNNYVTQAQIVSRKWKVIDNVPAIMFAKVGAALLLNRKRLIREPFLIDNNTMVYIPSAYWDIMFCKILFDTLNLSKYSQVGALPSYNGSDIEAIHVFLPTLPEQTAIGSFFQELDQLITLQQRNLEKSRRIKKAMLQKMFPENKQTVPAIRFKEFSGQNAEAWEQRKLEECTEISAGGDIDKSKLLNKGKYPVIANALTNDGIIGYYNDSYRIEAPAVTVTGRGNVGVAKARNVSFTPVVRLLSLKSEYDVIFLENAINIQNIVIESTGVPQLTVPQLGSYKIFFPTPPEQRDIGSFFQDLDKFIALQQRRLDKLLNLKKALLEQMMM